MGFWIFMFACDLICPLIMLMASVLFLKGGTENINPWCGYRTEMSMKNKETWIFAHKHCGKLWRKWGLILFIFTIVLFVGIIGQNEMTVSIVGLLLCVVQVIVLTASVFPTEAALKKNFDENGNRRM